MGYCTRTTKNRATLAQAHLLHCSKYRCRWRWRHIGIYWSHRHYTIVQPLKTAQISTYKKTRVQRWRETVKKPSPYTGFILCSTLQSLRSTCAKHAPTVVEAHLAQAGRCNTHPQVLQRVLLSVTHIEALCHKHKKSTHRAAQRMARNCTVCTFSIISVDPIRGNTKYNTSHR